MSSGVTVPRRLAEDLVLLVAYLLSSGRGLVDEPEGYGPLRCVDAARRVMDLVEYCGVRDEQLTRLHEQLRACLCGPMDDTDMVAFLDEACETMLTVLRDSELVR